MLQLAEAAAAAEANERALAHTGAAPWQEHEEEVEEFSRDMEMLD